MISFISLNVYWTFDSDTNLYGDIRFAINGRILGIAYPNSSENNFDGVDIEKVVAVPGNVKIVIDVRPIIEVNCDKP